MTMYHTCGQAITVIQVQNQKKESVPYFLSHDRFERTLTHCPECGKRLHIVDMVSPGGYGILQKAA